MNKTPMILPLDPQGKIYVLQDENGTTIGTGSRQVCEVLLYLITKAAAPSFPDDPGIAGAQKTNVRAAIKI